MDTLALKNELAGLLELPESKLDDSLLLEPLATWDSLTKVTLLGMLNDQFGLTLHPEILDQLKTLGELFDAVADTLAEPA
ncbi:acyl carrier protein [Pseudomonas sp. UFMG81]|uniref:acyl carrier protein n=1 Tax=Pseudomonas sp. UFMG81 TaxID=2745936 RepID=UPI001890B151|nr:acyl carrier protein [Pseudomonas sp. UFMG81]